MLCGSAKRARHINRITIHVYGISIIIIIIIDIITIVVGRRRMRQEEYYERTQSALARRLVTDTVLLIGEFGANA